MTPRYKLRTLLILLAVLPPLLMVAWQVKRIADDYWLLKYGPRDEVMLRYVRASRGLDTSPRPPGCHRVAEFLARLTPDDWPRP